MVMKNVFSFLFPAAVLAMLATGCSYTTVPRSVPLLADPDSVRLNGAVVLIANAEKDNTLSWIPTGTGEASSFKANRQAWSRTLVESLSRELARRGATVRPAPGRTFTIALPQIVFIETRDVYQFKVKAAISSGRGWSKEYTGSSSVDATSVFFIQVEADRLSGQALAHVIQQILSDDEFIQQVRAQ